LKITRGVSLVKVKVQHLRRRATATLEQIQEAAVEQIKAVPGVLPQSQAQAIRMFPIHMKPSSS